MNVKQLKEFIKDLPDDMDVCSFHDDFLMESGAKIEGYYGIDHLPNGIKYLLIG